jgi:hypothetical protein
MKYIAGLTEQGKYRIKVAAMGRALIQDAEVLLRTGINDFHLHIKTNVSDEKLGQIFK